MSSAPLPSTRLPASARVRLLDQAERRGLYVERYELRGAALSLQTSTDPECLIAGPAGTGKSVASLVKLHRRASAARIRGLICRKTRVSLTESGLVTWEQKVLGLQHPVVRDGPSRAHRLAYHYPNGSEIVVGGLDQPSRIMSTEYDVIYCFVGETRIESPSEIERAYVRDYSGPLITIRTALGNSLTGTPNHPILTDHGWVALGKLDEGDNVISRRLIDQERSGSNPNIQDKPATIAEIARALALTPTRRSERVKTVGMDFHGDGADGYVDIVSTARGLKDRISASLREPVPDCDSDRRDLQRQPVMGVRTLGKMLFGVWRHDIALFGRLSQCTKPFSILARFHPRLARARTGFPETLTPVGVNVTNIPLSLPLTLAARSKTPTLQLGLKSGVRDTDGGSYFDEATLPGEVTSDRIIHVERIDQPAGASRHVYNLQTSLHYYYANNIIAHNCQEATELEITDWESITTRFRGGVDAADTQLLADCNPDSDTHWLYQRCLSGVTTLLTSVHEDNPYLYDSAAKEWTSAGVAYMARLDHLTGVRKERLRYGRWVGAEGMVYDGWSPRLHIVNEEQLRALGIIV